MPHVTRIRITGACAVALIACSVFAGCASTPSPPEVAAPSAPASPSSTPTATAQSPAADDYSALCDANRAAAAAKAGTVAEDIAAVTVQAEVARGLLPMTGVSPEVAAGAEVFAASTEENLAILSQFPPDSLVSDVGLDPRFTQSDAVRNALSDPNYQAFIGWTIQTCGVDSTGG